ncbi:MAG: hypothetical protein LBF24_01745 [Puniceicoccales bacterium]|nr:hypothetical protein [Puniceicoccales bacterium]
METGSDPQLIFRNLLVAATARRDRHKTVVVRLLLAKKSAAVGPLLSCYRRLRAKVMVLTEICAVLDCALGSGVGAPIVAVVVAAGCVWMAMDDGPSRDAAAVAVYGAVSCVHPEDHPEEGVLAVGHVTWLSVALAIKRSPHWTSSR